MEAEDDSRPESPKLLDPDEINRKKAQSEAVKSDSIKLLAGSDDLPLAFDGSVDQASLDFTIEQNAFFEMSAGLIGQLKDSQYFSRQGSGN